MSENLKEIKEQAIKRSSKFSKKLTYKSNQNKNLAHQIRNYIISFGLTVPKTQRQYNSDKDRYLTDMETGEYLPHFDFLFKAYYNLMKVNKSVYAMFTDEQTGKQKQMIVSCWYSHHKLDHIWNMRKSQLIRKVWINHLKQNTFLFKNYTPIHLVLTVPHTNGKYRGKRFYADILVKLFNQMRKDKEFKKYIYGGEYGIEVTQSEKNGLHIHIHSLLFQSNKYSINEVREYIKKRWNELSDSTIIHYSTLHVNRKDEAGRWIMEDIPKESYYEIDANGNDSEVILREQGKRKKRFYLDQNADWFKDLPEDEKITYYSSGILEAIKYHFKDASYKLENGQYDIDLIFEILINTHNLKIYSKFGNFYGQSELNYTEKQENINIIDIETLDISKYETEKNEMDELSDEEEEELKAESLNAVANLINPFTGLPAKRNEYQLVISLAEKQKYYNRPEKNEVYYQPPNERDYFILNQSLSIKEIMKAMIHNNYNLLFENIEEIKRFSDYVKNYTKQYNY